MSYEDRYDASCDYDAEQQSEGYNEAVEEIYEHFEKDSKEIYSKKEILEILDGFL